MNKPISFTLAAAITVSTVGFSVPTTGWSAIPEIKVTTRKRTESLQEVPISIEAFTAEDLQRQSIINISDIALSTPGLSIEQQGSGGFITPVIRGMAQNNIGTDLSYDNNVGIFLNGVYQSGRNSIDMELVGIERVEVARGPQSALFGRSTFAGAINYIYADPTDEFEADFSTTIGSDEDYGTTLDISGPLGDAVKGRLSMGYRNFDGTFGNKAGGNNLQGYESKAIAGALLFTPSDALTATFNFLYNDRTNDQDAQFLVALNCGDNGFFGSTYRCGELDAVGDVDISGNGFSDNEVQQYSLKLEYDTGDYTVTSLTAFTQAEYISVLDRDYGSVELGTGLSLGVCDIGPGCAIPPLFPLPPIKRIATGIQSYAHGSSKNRDFSQEFRIASSNDSGLNWMGGLFYYKSDTSTTTRASLDNSGITPGLIPGESYAGFGGLFIVDDPFTESLPFNIFDADTETWAVFGQVDWDISDVLTLTGEIRYTDEEKEKRITFPSTPTIFKRSFNYTTPRLTLSYTPTDEKLVYTSLARGVRTGGINGAVCSPAVAPACTPPVQAAERFFEEEENWTLEFGTKNTLADGSVQVNAAVYYTEWEDLQLPALNADLIGTHVTNVDGGADIWGLEVDGIWQITDLIRVSLGYAYTKPEFQSGTLDGSVATSCGIAGDLCTIDPMTGAADVGGKTLGRVAEHQFNFGVVFEGTLADSGLNWYSQWNANYQSENYARSINRLEYGERTLVDMRTAIYTDDFELALWTKNLFDDEYVPAQALQPGFDGGRRIDAYQGNGRRYGLTATWRF